MTESCFIESEHVYTLEERERKYRDYIEEEEAMSIREDEIESTEPDYPELGELVCELSVEADILKTLKSLSE